MADFRPETTIYIFRSTGVDVFNQPFFESEGAKIAWYFGRGYLSFERYSYQREDRQYCRVQGKADELRHYDMLAFQNGTGKWIINRILAVDFINPNTTEITFEIDSMQTYMEDIEWCDCWIEREMQDNDWDGATPSWNNLQPEGLETGVMTRTLLSTETSELSFKTFDLVVLSKYDVNGEPNYNLVSVKNYPSGLNKITFSIPENGRITALEAMLDTYAAKAIDFTTAIQGMYVCPHAYANDPEFEKRVTITPNYQNIGGYKPINAKCCTSEFLNLEIANRRGNSVLIRPEQYTEVDAITLVLNGTFGNGAGGAWLYPHGYEGFPPDSGVILYNDIQAPWIGDSFTQWLVANRTAIATDVVGDVIEGGQKGAMVGGNVGMVAGAVAGAAYSASKLYDRSRDPAAMGGQIAGNILQLQLNMYGFSVNWVHPRTPNLRSIDHYFSRFGYRTNRLKKPNVNTRPLWNYVKTSGCVVKGPFNYNDKVRIQDAMDRGVTFWHVPSVVIGDYSDMEGNKQ